MEGTRVTDDDRAMLVGFINTLRDLLRGLLDRRRSVLSEAMRELLGRAWDEVEQERLFERVRDAIESRNYDDRLAEHGLRGNQLRFKLGTFNQATERLDIAESRLFVRPGRLRRLWQSALRCADVTADSLAIVVPPAGAIKELKAGAEAALEHRVSLGERFRQFRGRLVSRRHRVSAET
jgi:hypothetical protein